MMPTNRGGQNAVLIKILYVHPILPKSLDFFFFFSFRPCETIEVFCSEEPIISLGIRGVGNPPNCSGQTKIAFPEVNNLSHISL